ncbi:MAG: polynucleotide adenylyltransferase PcnB [Gammaproteobacteria bacterium]
MAAKDSPTATFPTTIPRPSHNISRADISEGALKVLYRLKHAGFEGYLVGGGVRDLLLGREPKDFDIVTDARPEQVRGLFRNCRLIGRRFRLAHVRFGREVIEVATFRARVDMGGEGERIEVNGRILRDNVYGTLEEDAWRRDFSINSLYYNIRDFSVADFTGGMADLRTGTLRLVGDPEVRFREDPVRIVRAVRFAATLGFRIHPATEAMMSPLAHLLDEVPPARLYEEMLKLFHSGCAARAFELLQHHDVFSRLFPPVQWSLDREQGLSGRMLVVNALQGTDTRIAEGKPVTPAFLFAALLWLPLRQHAEELQQEGLNEALATQKAANLVLSQQVSRTALPRRITNMIREIWGLQPRLVDVKRKQALDLLAHPRFRAAYDFLLLRAQTGDEVGDQAQGWTDLQAAEDATRRQQVLDRLVRPQRRSRRSSRRREAQ